MTRLEEEEPVSLLKECVLQSISVDVGLWSFSLGLRASRLGAEA